MTTPEHKVDSLQSRRVRRATLAGFYTSFPLSLWLLSNTLHGDALPKSLGWYGNVEPLAAFAFFAVGIFCLVKILRSSVGGIFRKHRDERQQAAFAQAYSLSYRILGNLIIFPVGAFLVISIFTGYVPELTPQAGVYLLSALVMVASLLPKTVAMWLEPDPFEMEVNA